MRPPDYSPPEGGPPHTDPSRRNDSAASPINSAPGRWAPFQCLVFPGLALWLASVIGPDVCAQSRVVLNEYLAVPSGNQVEFVELYVGGSLPLVPERIGFRDANPTWRLLPPDQGPIEPGTYVILTSDPTAFRLWHTALRGPLPDAAVLLGLRPWPALNNGGDSLLVALDGVVLERTGYSGADVERGQSRERISPYIPAHAAAAWGTTSDFPGTPGARNALHALDVTPPYVIGAEELDTTHLLVWLNEPVWNSPSLKAFRPGGSEMDVSCGGAHAGICETLVLSHSGRPLPSTVRMEGLTDLSGNQSLPEVAVVHALPDAGAVRLSEVLVRGDPEFAELTVDGPNPVTLRTSVIRTSRNEISLDGALSTHLLMPDDVTVVPVDFLTGGDWAVLATHEGTIMDSVRFGPELEDPRFLDHSNRSLRRVGGAARDWASSVSPVATPGTDSDRDLRRRAAPPTTPTVTPPLVLSEVMYDPLVDPFDDRPDQTEFLEWTNRSLDTVDLFGSHLLFETNERGERESLRVGYQPTTLAPDSSVVLVSLPNHVLDSSPVRDYLSSVWPTANGRAAALGTRASLGLRNSGRDILLVSRNGRLLSLDSYAPEQHHPALSTTKGRSLEKRSQDGLWTAMGTTTHPDGATPGWVYGLGEGRSETALPAPPPAATGAPFARVQPTSIYPDHPDLGGSADILVSIPPEAGPRLGSVTVYGLHGRAVRHLQHTRLMAGHVTLKWDGRDDDNRFVPAGIYVVVVRVVDTPAWLTRRPVAVLRR